MTFPAVLDRVAEGGSVTRRGEEGGCEGEADGGGEGIGLRLGEPRAAGRGRPAGEGRKAFTRADVLVTVAGVALLGVVATAWGVRAGRQTRMDCCRDNLRQVAAAVRQFSADHEDRLPAPDPAQRGDFWWWYKEQVKGYAGLSGPSGPGDAVFACPDDRGYTDARPFHASPRFDYGSYVFNGVTLPAVPQIAGWQVAAVRKPARTLLVMEWTAHAPLSWHRSRTGKRNAPFYCDAESMVAFVDGHAGITRIYYDGYNPAYTQDPPHGYDYQFSGH